MAALRPSLLVELGVHYGESYFGLCQAVRENQADCKCYAIDTWHGDPHSEPYGEEVFEEVRAYNQANYASFSYLLRNTFDAACPQFSDGTIDLLHIDGLHTYEAIRRDFETWIPKVRPGGIVLLHDVHVRHADFGVWKWWEELGKRYPSFAFTHSWGLGVVRVPGGNELPEGLLSAMFSGSEKDRAAISEHYAIAAEHLDLSMRQHADQPPPYLYVAGASERVEIVPGEWHTYLLHLPHGSDSGAIRIDLADRPCLAEVASIVLKDAAMGAALHTVCAKADIESLERAQDLVPLPGGSSAAFVGHGYNSHLLVPVPDGVNIARPMTVEIRMRLQPDISSAANFFRAAEHDRAVAERAWALQRVETLQTELRQHQTARLTLTAEFRRLKTSSDSLAAKCEELAQRERELQRQRAGLEREITILQLKEARLENESALLRSEAGLARDLASLLQRERSYLEGQLHAERSMRVQAQSQFETEQAKRRDLLNSYSWKWSKPLRFGLHFLRTGNLRGSH